MKKLDIKKNKFVIDRWFTEWGTGRIIKVLKTVFYVKFSNLQRSDNILKYDYPHARFLDEVKPV